MTITQDPSAALVAVVGATGIQGGSVVDALAESDKPHRVRGFTRDATKPAAQKLITRGVEVIVVSLVVKNKVEVYKAFAGTEVAFLMTNYWEHMDVEREINEGKLLIDAAKAAGVSRIVWSGLPSISKLSGGKYVHVWRFDGKAVVTEYARESGVPFVDVQAGFYGTSLLTNPIAITKQDDGSFAITWPVKPTWVAPFIDAPNDYGLFVRYVLELPVFPDGAEIVACSEKITIEDAAQQFSKETGKNLVFRQVSVDEFKARIETLGLPPHIVQDYTDGLQAFDEFGCAHFTYQLVGGDTAPAHSGLPRQTRTWAEFSLTGDWSEALP
ncbi:NAD(P)-binding protein [Mycena polygramma]|nr:NAD(P)-binding protein [Mycena polygramma]